MIKKYLGWFTFDDFTAAIAKFECGRVDGVKLGETGEFGIAPAPVGALCLVGGDIILEHVEVALRV